MKKTAKLKKDKEPRAFITALLLAAAAAVCAYGAKSGEAEIIFVRAVNICLECIGIG